MGAVIRFEFTVSKLSDINPFFKPKVDIKLDIDGDGFVNDEKSLKVDSLFPQQLKWEAEIELADNKTEGRIFVITYLLAKNAEYKCKIFKNDQPAGEYSGKVRNKPVDWFAGKVKK